MKFQRKHTRTNTCVGAICGRDVIWSFWILVYIGVVFRLSETYYAGRTYYTLSGPVTSALVRARERTCNRCRLKPDLITQVTGADSNRSRVAHVHDL